MTKETRERVARLLSLADAAEVTNFSIIGVAGLDMAAGNKPTDSKKLAAYGAINEVEHLVLLRAITELVADVDRLTEQVATLTIQIQKGGE